MTADGRRRRSRRTRRLLARGRNGALVSKDDEFDRPFRDRFMDLHFAAARRELDHWLKTRKAHSR